MGVPGTGDLLCKAVSADNFIASLVPVIMCGVVCARRAAWGQCLCKVADPYLNVALGLESEMS